jgi:hypothetical protein
MMIADLDLVKNGSGFFLRSVYEPPELWPAHSFGKEGNGKSIMDEHRAGLDFMICVGTADPRRTKDRNHRRRLISLVTTDTSGWCKTSDLIPRDVLERSEWRERWPYSFGLLGAWEIEGSPQAEDVVPATYKELGHKHGQPVRVDPGELGNILQLKVSPVSLTLLRCPRRVG